MQEPGSSWSLLGLREHCVHELVVEGLALGQELPVLDEVDGPLSGQMLGIEGIEPDERLSVHVGSISGCSSGGPRRTSSSP